MASIFDNLKITEEVEESKDTLGGSLLETNVYDALITLAYIDYSQSKAMNLNVTFKINGNDVRQTFFLTSGEKKGCKPYFVNKAGKNQYLPGYIVANDLCLLTIDKHIFDTEPEAKVIKVWDYDAKKEIPQEKQVLVELINKKVKIAVEQQTVDVNKKDEKTDEYQATGETRNINEVTKVFHEEYGVTVQEAKAGEREPDFMNRWIEKRKGTIVDKTKSKKPTMGGKPPFTPDAKPVKSLFD